MSEKEAAPGLRRNHPRDGSGECAVAPAMNRAADREPRRLVKNNASRSVDTDTPNAGRKRLSAPG